MSGDHSLSPRQEEVSNAQGMPGGGGGGMFKFQFDRYVHYIFTVTKITELIIIKNY